MKFYEWNTVVYRQLVKDESGGMWVIAYDGAAAPQYICGENIEELTEIPPPQGLLEEDSISASKRKTVERRKMVISPLTEDSLCIIDQSTRRDRISAVATEQRLSKRTVKRWYYMFLSQGEKGLVPKGGRKTACVSEDEASFRWALNRYYYSARKMSLRDAYDLMLLAQYSSPDGILSDKYPSFNRFRYYYRKHNYVLKASTSREGQTNYARNTRPLYGKATDMVSGIGCYEMDATIADIYLVSAKDRSLCVGRPYIFLATDVATQLIAGVYVGFESGETAVIECLRNAVSDKVEYCARYGITINSEDWPSRGLPEEIISDKGPEFFGERIKELCGLFGMRAMSLPAYRPELKGTVEKMFDLLQIRYKKLLTHDGVVDDGYAERGAPDYRREARLNLYELTQIAIDIIIYLNAHRVIDGFIRPLKMAQDSVPVIASYMWRWYKQQGLANLTIIDTQEQMLALFPRGVGTFTRHGLEFRKLFYRNVNFDDRCARAGLKGKEKAIIAYDTLQTDYVWLFEGGRYYRFDKTSKNDVFSDTSWDEATAYLRRERLDSAKLRKQETQARVQSMARIKKIRNQARAEREGLLDKDAVKGIPDARTDEMTREGNHDEDGD